MEDEMEMERTIRAVHIPKIDVHDKIMQSLGEQVSEHGAHPQRRRRLGRHIVWAAIAAAVCLVVSGYAYNRIAELRDNTGEATLRFEYEPNLAAIDEVTESYFRGMGPGEAIAVYNPSGNPDNIVRATATPAVLTSVAQLRAAAGPAYPYPRQLPAQFEFVEARAAYGFERPDIAAIRAESERAGGAVVVKKLEPTGQLDSVTLMLRTNQAAYQVFMTDRWGKGVVRDSTAEKSGRTVLVGTAEAAIFQEDGQTKLYWKADKEADSLFYMLTTDDQGEQAEAHLLELMHAFAAAAEHP